ncbi:hypothetical protein [Cupriavidus basilensis]|nr:hypothetical protein [Cupriavidus basilensis]
MRIVALAFVALLAGCTTVSEVSPAGNGNFTVGTRHMGGVDSWQEIMASSLRRADEYCKGQGKEMESVDMKTHGARGWTPLESELTFKCVAAPKA